MRKPRIQPSFASLTLADREQLADWLRTGTYEAVLERVNKPRSDGGFGLDISEKPIRTFHAKVALLDAINSKLPADRKIDLALFETLAQRQIYYLTSAENDKSLLEAHQSILNASCNLAGAADNTPTQLATLQRLIDFPARAEIRANKEERAQAKEHRDEQMHSHKIKMDELHHQLAERNTVVREKSLDFQREKEANRANLNSKFKIQNSKLGLRALPPGHFINEEGRECDELGPIAQTLEEINARVRKQFGITPEESARRAELRKTWKNPNIPKYARTNPQPQPSANEPSSTNGPNPPIGGTNSVTPTPNGWCEAQPQSGSSPNRTDLAELSRAALNDTPSAPEAAQPPLKSHISNLESLPPNAQPSPKDTDQNQTPGGDAADGWCEAQPQSGSSPNRTDFAELSRDDTNETHAAPADQKPNPSTPTQDSALSTHDLSATVDRYTVARVREYIAYNQRYTPWPHRHSPPAYITELRHCPCGSQSPCPTHESGDFRPFPSYFWHVTPFSLEYEIALRDRNLPYRKPTEYLP